MKSLFLVTLVCLPIAAISQQMDLNVLLMQTTFLVEGPTKTPGINTFGTAFLLLRPDAVQPVAGQTGGRLVLVTATFCNSQPHEPEQGEE